MATSLSAEKMSDEAQHETDVESETDSDDSEEDSEPKLCYDRVKNDLANVLSKDCASCIAVHSKFLALGTHWGSVRIMDYLGHMIEGKEYDHHTTTVNHISVDQTGDFIASCSDDGKVCIIGLYSNEAPQIIDFSRPVKSVALEPDYSKSRSKQFVIGTNDDKLVLNEKGYFSSKKTTIHDGGGSIREIRWCGHLLAWSDDTGVRVYDFTSKSRITSISKDHNHRPDLYHCNLHWKDERTLLVGWADTVKVVSVKDRISQDVRDLPPRYCEIIAQFSTPEYFICGIASLENDLVLLTYDKACEKEGGRVTFHKPNLRIVEPHMEYCDEISNDVLSMNGYQTHRCNDYHLENVIEDNLFYIVSPKDVIVARPRDQDDHITWLLEHDEYDQAMEAAVQHSKELKKHSFQAIGRKFLDYLIEQQRFEDAAKLCRRIFGKDKEKWEAEAYKFARIGQLKSLAPFLPMEQPTLNPAIYEMVLNDFLQTNYKVFLQLIKEWPFTLYKVQAIIEVVIDRLEKDTHNKDLLHALAELYGYERAFDKSLGIYLKLKDNDVFVLIHKHSLFEAVSNQVVKLMELNEEQAVTMLIDNVDHVPVEKVVRQLEKHQRFLYVYLDRLAMKDQQAIKNYADQMVSLYSEFNRAKLLPFLKGSAQYDLDKALNQVKVRGFKKEQVFLLVRTGDTNHALHLIIDELRDVDQAIEFCKEHNEEELWEDLIRNSLDKPDFIRGLLNNIGTHVDPIILIRRIQTGMEIPGLRDSLVKILQDYNLQMSLRKGCKNILVADSFNLMNRLIKTQRKAISVHSGYICQICHERILVAETHCTKDVTVFFCSHAVHDDCLGQMETCPICSTQRRGPGNSSSIRK